MELGRTSVNSYHEMTHAASLSVVVLALLPSVDTMEDREQQMLMTKQSVGTVPVFV